MGRKDQFEDKLTNPSSLTIEWAGGNDAGHLKAYDKEAGGKIKLAPLTFVVLKEKNCLDGFLAAKGCGAWSNEISNLKTESLTVMFKDGDSYKPYKTGMYADIVEEMKSAGIKYHKVIYAMVVDSPDIETGKVVRLMLKGAAASSWFNLKAEDKKGAVALSGVEDGQTGAVRYKIPVFSGVAVSEEDDAQAEVAYEKVDAYLKSRKPVDAPVEAPEQVPDDLDNEVPF
jgi:hypothetical protein|tara:strand:- start:46 stop:729 length:684 start_codon:yes stop_codon:yes gene_type:complete